MLHLYKSRLQHYAQKQNLTLPVYSSELDGPPHARRFRSKVTIDGVTYETQEFFSTLKEAEHAAAKVAFESLALNDTQEVSTPFFPDNVTLFPFWRFQMFDPFNFYTTSVLQKLNFFSTAHIFELPCGIFSFKLTFHPQF